MDPTFWITNTQVAVVTPDFTFSIDIDGTFKVITEFMTLVRYDEDVELLELLESIQNKTDYCTDICSLIGDKFTLNWIDDNFHDDFIQLQYPIPVPLVATVLEYLV